MSTTLITGNTYPVKEQIKALGGRWDRAAQGWQVPTDRADEARALVDGAGPVARRATSYRQSRRNARYAGYVSNIATFSDGTEVYTNKNGRCEDAPCCGCCS